MTLDVLDYAVERLREEPQRRHEALSCQLLALREEKRRIQSEIANLGEAIAAGKSLPSVMAAITDRKEKIREITHRLIEPGPESFQQKPDELRTFAFQRLSASCLQRQTTFAKPARYWLSSLESLR